MIIRTAFTFVSLVSFVVSAAGTELAAESASSMYAAALAHEQTARGALADDQATPSVLKEVRSVVAVYEAIVRRYPASGYADNALWQAGRLSLDAYARFGEPQDKTSGIRFVRALANRYPSSSLVRLVPEQLARVGATLDPGDEGALKAASSSKPAAAAVLPAGARVATITEIRRAVLPEVVRITIELNGEVSFREERLANPPRVFLDLSSTRAAPSLADHTLRFDLDNDVVRQVRVGRHPNNTTRVVLDAAGIASYSVYPLYGPYRLVIDCARAPLAASTVAPLPAAPASTPPPPRPPEPQVVAGVQPMPGASIPQPPSALHADVRETAIPAASPPAPNATGGFSIARQLGLGVSRIVIDPGHGGHDPGASGKGVTEAELVLDVALRLEMLLQKVPGVEVILTRRTDEFVPLPERTAIANRENADLFLSIHANASSSAQSRGVETYFLNFATNLSAAAVAARENAASGHAMASLPEFVKAIALNNKLDESRDFATQVQRAMLERLRGSNKTLKDLGVKQAPFVVLIGAAMPSVLAEVSFVTNPQEARLLRGTAYRQRIAEALFNAIRKYQMSLKRATKTAHQ